MPAPIACPFAAVSYCPLAATKAMGQGWSPVAAHEARPQWYPEGPAFHILRTANIPGCEVGAACSVIEHGHSVVLHDSIQIKGVATSLWPAIVVFTLPLQRGESIQVPSISVWHNVVG